jgi:transcriptional regulator with XRE-family HTH domain
MGQDGRFGGLTTQPVWFRLQGMSEHPLKTYRTAEGLTQAGLAAKLGVTDVTVSRWETGARKIELDLIASISEKTGIPKSALRPDLAAMFSEAAA